MRLFICRLTDYQRSEANLMAVIFYLSGTGNSMYAAKSIAQELEQCRLEGITGYLKRLMRCRTKLSVSSALFIVWRCRL